LARGLHIKSAMLRILSLVLLAWWMAPAQEPAQEPASGGALNVNERYVIEAMDADTPGARKVAAETRQAMDALVGQKLNQEKLDAIAAKLKEQFRNHKVTQRVSKGDKPDHVKVTFEFKRNAVEVSGDSDDFRLLYHSKNNWTFGGTVRIPINDSGFALLGGALTDNDQHVERFSGVRGGFDQALAGNRARVKFIAETYRSQWNAGAVLAQLPAGGVYRGRQNFEPTLSFRLLNPLTLTTGVSFARYQYQFPAARYLSAHAFLSSLRFEKEWEATSGDKQSLEAGYDLRAATSSLGGDARFTRQEGRGRYVAKAGPHEAVFEGRLGTLTGGAPLYELFVLGNTQTLRGWNRFDVAPLGGNRMAHGSAEYRYRGFRFVYDTGAVWVASNEAKQRHSLACGYGDGGIALLVAFPLRDGNVTPVVMLGYTF